MRRKFTTSHAVRMLSVTVTCCEASPSACATMDTTSETESAKVG